MEALALPLLLAVALGLLAQRVGMPPLVGYLAAGFALRALDVDPGSGIDLVADLGVLLLLFGIGLKLKLSDLARPAVWLGGGGHMLATTVFTAGVLYLLGRVGLPLVGEADTVQLLTIGFALAFSSTVFAVKSLAQFSEASSLAGTLAISILVLQDLVAVVYLVAVGSTPSVWAPLVIVGVVLARPLWFRLVDWAGGELMVLLGVALAVGVGAGAFGLVDVKADLGALVLGLLLANHPRARELSEAILAPKDLLLVGFFLSIGLSGLPTAGAVLTALVLLLFVPLKALLHMELLSRFGMRKRTTWHAGVTLASHSEFGLIVAATAVSSGVLPPEWQVVLALTVALSFVAAAPPNTARYTLYDRFRDTWLDRYEPDEVIEEDSLIDPGDATVLVFGMGRVGVGAYDELARAQEGRVIGVERRSSVLEDQAETGRVVVRGDALDPDFWDRVRLHPQIRVALLATNNHGANIVAARQIRRHLPDVQLVSIAKTWDEVEELQSVGVAVARNLYEEAGQGLADDAIEALPDLVARAHLEGRPPLSSQDPPEEPPTEYPPV